MEALVNKDLHFAFLVLLARLRKRPYERGPSRRDEPARDEHQARDAKGGPPESVQETRGRHVECHVSNRHDQDVGLVREVCVVAEDFARRPLQRGEAVRERPREVRHHHVDERDRADERERERHEERGEVDRRGKRRLDVYQTYNPRGRGAGPNQNGSERFEGPPV